MRDKTPTKAPAQLAALPCVLYLRESTLVPLLHSLMGIARVSTARHPVAGDRTTSACLFAGRLCYAAVLAKSQPATNFPYLEARPY
jgi:hypothetical protein